LRSVERKEKKSLMQSNIRSAYKRVKKMRKERGKGGAASSY
jgi:hypothetical protein